MKKNWKNEKMMKAVSIAILTTIFAILIFLIFINETAINYALNQADDVFSNSFQVHYLDVGQANASLIIFPHKSAMIIDTGSCASEKSFLREVEYILQKNGIKEIDYLVLTHSDEDHVGGVTALLEKFQINRIFRPKILSSSDYDKERTGMIDVDSEVYAKTIDSIYQEQNCIVEFVENKTMFVYDVEIEFWAAERNDISNTNYYSPFVHIKYGERNLLFTGDAIAKRESEFISRYQAQGESFKIDFLLVSHHGASGSTTTEFLQTIKPEIAVISSGDNLHPSKEVLTRLNDCGVIKILQTKTMGSILFGVKNSGAYVNCCLSFKLDMPFIIVLISLVFLVFAKFLYEKAGTNKINMKNFFVLK